jgi:uncharacterized protein (DUF849 family)
MNFEVFITCALTGAGGTSSRSNKLPITPREIAASAIEAAKAGAAIAHIHLRNSETGAPSRDPALYRETVARIREAGSDVVTNLTAGMGGDLVLGGAETHGQAGADARRAPRDRGFRHWSSRARPPADQRGADR